MDNYVEISFNDRPVHWELPDMDTAAVMLQALVQTFGPAREGRANA